MSFAIVGAVATVLSLIFGFYSRWKVRRAQELFAENAALRKENEDLRRQLQIEQSISYAPGDLAKTILEEGL